ncbi:MAG: hypothetical protein IJF78_09635 [Clostridia bacterium]|nr:hypothetical protein [Clostridia bacterium]
MEKKLNLPEEMIRSVLAMFGLETAFGELTEYINWHSSDGEQLLKVIFSVRLESGRRIVVKILREDDDPVKERGKIEKQSEFSAFMRNNGIRTPHRYRTGRGYCGELVFEGIPCHVTAEDWCGEEITEINTGLSYRIGELMARMHVLSFKNQCEIGCGTLFSAAGWNDVDAFEQFCKLCQNEYLDQAVVRQICVLHDEKLNGIREVWDRLPKAAVQGDISINNLTDAPDGLIVFDYNNAGDEVLVSDLVMEGLLTAYEMDLPEGAAPHCREEFFPAFLSGYLSVRKLSSEEADAAWLIYTLYHSLWFTRIVYNDDSLEKLVEKEDYSAANRLLSRMLADMIETDDGRFRK